MRIYQVGGAVRDQLLNLTVKDRDWVVVGATPDDLIKRGFIAIGQDFPVFLHPQSKEEYALARTERKSGKGYTGFKCYSATDVTLEEDLQRRDLTVNAIAKDENGNLIDPYNGLKDLENRILRHISPAFGEDPLRVLRVARFAARFDHLGFTIAEETKALMRQMTADDELQYLSPERVWSETRRALCSQSPAIFFQELRNCGALDKLFPEIAALFGVPQPKEHHPEIDTGIHTLMSLTQVARLSSCPITRFAVLMHDLGKGSTPKEDWPQHIGHEKRGIELIDSFCSRMRVPKKYCSLAKQVSLYHTHCHNAFNLKPSTIVNTLEKIHAYKQDENFERFLNACEADARGRSGLEDKPYPQKTYFKQALLVSKEVDVQALIAAGYSGIKLGNAIHEQRVQAVRQIWKKHVDE